MKKMKWERIMAFAKPCPFCGSKRVYTETKEHFEESDLRTCCIVRCGECDAKIIGSPVMDENGSFVQDYAVCQRQALKMWNRRATA